MQSKSLLVAVAAFAVTATGAQAYGGAILNRANISEEQRSALVSAHELRKSGDVETARNVLVEAGVDEEVLHELREAAKETRAEIQAAVESGDYELFLELVADTPLADGVSSEADFELFQEAQTLRQSGEYADVKRIYNELGLDKKSRSGHHFVKRHILSQLTEEQRDALRVAKQANDRNTVKAILKDAGVERH